MVFVFDADTHPMLLFFLPFLFTERETREAESIKALPEWEQFLLKRKPIIALDGYVPNSATNMCTLCSFWRVCSKTAGKKRPARAIKLRAGERRRPGI